MKGKILLGLALTSMISTSVFAVEIKHGKLLKHKEWSTGDVSSTFATKNAKEDLEKFKAMLKQKNIDFTGHESFTYSSIKHATGHEGKRTQVGGLQFNYVMNNTDGAQVYIFTNSICAVTSDKTTECMFYTDEIMLDPYGEAFELQDSHIKPVFHSSGKHETFNSSYVLHVSDDGMIRPISGSTSEGVAHIR